MEYGDDVDESVLVFTRYGKAMRRPKEAFVQDRDPADIHLWDSTRDTPEFLKDFKVADHVDQETRNSIISIIQKNWDCFYSAGVRKPILGFEFCIDTGASPPIC